MMLLLVMVTVYPLTIETGRVRCELNCDRAWTGDTIEPGSLAATEGTRSELGDDAVHGMEPELFELIGLAAGPGD